MKINFRDAEEKFLDVVSLLGTRERGERKFSAPTLKISDAWYSPTIEELSMNYGTDITNRIHVTFEYQVLNPTETIVKVEGETVRISLKEPDEILDFIDEKYEELRGKKAV